MGPEMGQGRAGVWNVILSPTACRLACLEPSLNHLLFFLQAEAIQMLLFLVILEEDKFDFNFYFCSSKPAFFSPVILTKTNFFSLLCKSPNLSRDEAQVEERTKGMPLLTCFELPRS